MVHVSVKVADKFAKKNDTKGRKAFVRNVVQNDAESALSDVVLQKFKAFKTHCCSIQFRLMCNQKLHSRFGIATEPVPAVVDCCLLARTRLGSTSAYS